MRRSGDKPKATGPKRKFVPNVNARRRRKGGPSAAKREDPSSNEVKSTEPSGSLLLTDGVDLLKTANSQARIEAKRKRQKEQKPKKPTKAGMKYVPNQTAQTEVSRPRPTVVQRGHAAGDLEEPEEYELDDPNQTLGPLTLENLSLNPPHSGTSGVLRLNSAQWHQPLPDTEDGVLMLQLPYHLPCKASKVEEKKSKNPKDRDYVEESEGLVKHALSDSAPGQMGTLRIHASGRVTLVLRDPHGDPIELCVSSSGKCRSRHEVYAFGEAPAHKCVSFGPVIENLVVTPAISPDSNTDR